MELVQAPPLAERPNPRSSRPIQKYQTLVDSGVQNSQLYFNLGNAYVQSDSVGRAIANYQRAAKLRPLDFKISRNLDFALSAVGKQPDLPMPPYCISIQAE